MRHFGNSLERGKATCSQHERKQVVERVDLMEACMDAMQPRLAGTGRSRRTDHADACTKAINTKQVGGLRAIRIAPLQPIYSVSLGSFHLLLDQLGIIQQVDPAGI